MDLDSTSFQGSRFCYISVKSYDFITFYFDTQIIKSSLYNDMTLCMPHTLFTSLMALAHCFFRLLNQVVARINTLATKTVPVQKLKKPS